MAKVLKIENRIVSIGRDDGSIDEYDIGYFNYVPHVNDEVKIYKDGDMVIIAQDGVENDGKHLVNRNTYGLLGILLGWLGINEFYAGHKARGILSCVFFWTGIPWIVNFIKGVIALTKSADVNGNIRI